MLGSEHGLAVCKAGTLTTELSLHPLSVFVSFRIGRSMRQGRRGGQGLGFP